MEHLCEIMYIKLDIDWKFEGWLLTNETDAVKHSPLILITFEFNHASGEPSIVLATVLGVLSGG